MADDPFANTWPRLPNYMPDDPFGLGAASTNSSFNGFGQVLGNNATVGPSSLSWPSFSGESTGGIPGIGPTPTASSPLIVGGAAGQPSWENVPATGEGPEGPTGPRWPWLRAEPDTPGFRMQPDGSVGQSGSANEVHMMAGAYGTRGAGEGDSLAAFSASPDFLSAEPRPWWSLRNNESAGDMSKFDRPASTNGPVEQPESASKINMMGGAYETLGMGTGGSFAGFGLSPDFATAQPQPWWSLQKSDGQTDPTKLGWPAPFSFESDPFAMRSTGLPPSAQTGTGTQAWWAPAQDQSVGSDNQAELHWPWLRAETAADSPDLRLLPDGLMNELGVADRLPMTAGSYTSPDAQASSSSSSRGGMFRPTGLQASSSDPSRQAVDAGGVLATSVAWPMGDLLAGSEGAGSLFGKLGSLAARAAPMAAGAASAAAAALPFLFIPTNTQSGTVDLGEGLRARVRPGQRSVEIERRTGDGPFGGDFLAHWETLPVGAELHIGDDGATSLKIDNRQLEDAVGPDAAARAWDMIGSAMARPKRPARKEDEDTPPAGIGHNSGQYPDQGAQPPEPGDGDKSSLGPEVAKAVAEKAADYFKRPDKPPPITDDEAKRVEQIRQVMKVLRQEAPVGDYQGEGGFMTGAGVKMHPNLPDPAAGRDYKPDIEEHGKGYVGELNLTNRIQTLMPNEVIVRYGNGAGLHGPDVISVSPDSETTFWESKFRTAAQSTGPRNAPAQTERSFNNAKKMAEIAIREAMQSGRLDPEVGEKALENVRDQKITIATVGTGNAHGGLVEHVRGQTRYTPGRP